MITSLDLQIHLILLHLQHLAVHHLLMDLVEDSQEEPAAGGGGGGGGGF